MVDCIAAADDDDDCNVVVVVIADVLDYKMNLLNDSYNTYCYKCLKVVLDRVLYL